MPVTFKPAAHAANSFQNATEVTSLGLMCSSCAGQWDICDEILQSFIGRGPDATRGNLQSAHTGLVSTILSAYNQHHALILRPDDVWLAILVQFSFYVNAHAEELRDKFVAHEGKKQVAVRAIGDRFTVDFGYLAKCMTGEMDKFIVDSALKGWILPRFSTTTDNDTIVAAVLMMATLREYFTYYGVLVACGIPKVTLEGEKSDWEDILQRASKLKEYGKETTAWYALLEPVLTRFVRAFDAPDADENLDFWQKVADVRNLGSGMTDLSGWITAFCAFSAKGKWLGLPLDDQEDRTRTRLSEPLILDGTHYHAIDISGVPLGHAAVDVLLNDNGEEFDTSMVAGLIATRVSDSGDTSLSESGIRDTVSPVAGWWIFTKRSGLSRQEEERHNWMKPVPRMSPESD